MLVMMREKWYKNEKKLRAELVKFLEGKDDCPEYKELVKLVFDIIVNSDEEEFSRNRLLTNRITQIDDGDYQGTLLFTIPFDTYQPVEYEYLMTYIGYGSCSGCDALQHAFYCHYDEDIDGKVNDIMEICRNLVANTIHPFNNGWRGDDYRFVQVKWEE